MALNPQTIQFLFNQLPNATTNSFSGVAAQLFEYLNKEVKDNPVFDKYMSEGAKWTEWINSLTQFYGGQWSVPVEYEDAKSLSLHVYKEIAEKKDNGFFIGSLLFGMEGYAELIRKINTTFIGFFGQALNDIVNANPESDSAPPKKIKGDTVFIIHGHDNELKAQLQLLLKVAGVNNFVLHEQPDKGRTIIEKLVEETEQSGYAIALLTPDDLVDDGKNRARQNVILELGYFLGKIGKERVRIIVRDDVEIPSDLQGILYEKYDSAGAWKMKLLKEIQAVGIYVDLNAVVSSF